MGKSSSKEKRKGSTENPDDLQNGEDTNGDDDTKQETHRPETDRETPAPLPSAHRSKKNQPLPPTPKTEYVNETVNAGGSHDDAIYRAIFDYTSTDADNLTFEKDDLFLLLEGGDTAGWWKAEHLNSGKRGFVPSTYVEQELNVVTLKAMYDYKKREVDDLDFLKDDKLIFIQDVGEWRWVRHQLTGKLGFVPSTYVVPDDDNEVTSHDWWFDMKRQDANKQLILPGNPQGTFLVRKSAEENTYALSIRFLDPDNPQSQGIRHYKIRFKEDGKRCFIHPKASFTSVAKLIQYYQANTVLCCQLGKACPKEPESVPFKDIEIERESLVVSHKLGSGCFGDVFKGKWRKQVDVAIKTLKPKSMSAEEFMQEAKVMHKLRHRKLVLLMGVCTKEEPMYIITEFMVKGALRDHLLEHKTEIPFKTLIEMAAQIADGMSYLEEQQFVHCDVRAANMLVGENNITKVADFGLARFLQNEQYSAPETKAKFPVKWTAPEAARSRIFTVKSDVWSFGVLLYEMVTYGRVPYPGMANNDVLEEVTNGYRLPKPPDNRYQCPESLYEMMLKCWSPSPAERPTFQFLNDYFDDYFIATEPSYLENTFDQSEIE